MKKDKLKSVTVMCCIVLPALAALSVLSAQGFGLSSMSDNEKTLQLIAPYLTWEKMNKEPIGVRRGLPAG